MARHSFAGTDDDLVYSNYALGGRKLLALAPNVSLDLYDAATGGSQVTDLTDTSGQPITSVSADADGFIPEFFGPDGVVELWADGGGPRKLLLANDIAASAAAAAQQAEEAAAAALAVGTTNDTVIAGRIQEPTSATAAALNAAFVGPTALPGGSLAFTDTGSDAVPFSVSPVDGKIYASSGWRTGQAVRTGDGFGTVEVGPDFVALGSGQPFLTYLGRVAEGYIAVTTNGTNTLAGGAEIWRSQSWATGWAKVRNIGTVAPLSIGEPRTDPATGGTVWVIGEYSQTVGANHHVWISRNGGATWTDGGAVAAINSGQNNHIHGVCFDPTTRRVYVSRGDAQNAWYGYSADFGLTWVAVPGRGILAVNGSPYHQPVLNFPMPAGIVNNADASAGYAGAWMTDRTNHVTTQSLRLDSTLAGGANQFAAHPVARGAMEAFAVAPMTGARTSMKWYVMGTGDGGRTWHKVYEGAQAANEHFDYGIVGPDPQGRMYVHKRTGTTGTTTGASLLMAEPLTWVNVQTPPVRAVGSDLVSALVQAGLVDPSVAASLDLAGGRLKAGQADVNGTNATLTLGNGSGIAAVDTPAGTTEVRFRPEGVNALTLTKNDMTLGDGKNIKTGATIGTMFPSASWGKLGFWGATPIVRPTGTPATATDLATALALLNDIRAKLISLGLIG